MGRLLHLNPADIFPFERRRQALFDRLLNRHALPLRGLKCHTLPLSRQRTHVIPVLSGIVAVALYAAGSLVAYRMIGDARTHSKALRLLTLGAIAFHAVTIALQLGGAGSLDFGFFVATSVIFWLLPTILLILREPVEGLLLAVLPLSAIALAASLALEGQPAPLDISEPEFALHVLLSLVGYTLLLMSALQSLLVLLVDHSMRRHRVSALMRLLPPLETMETMLFKLIAIGFALITLGIILGAWFALGSDQGMGSEHILPSLIAWFLFLFLLVGRRLLGWRGRAASAWTLLAFGLLAGGYLGNKFLLEVLVGG